MVTGQRIKERRKTLRIGADDLAAAIGVSRATLYRYENGDIEKLPTTAIEPLAKALETTPEYLMGWTDDPKPRKATPGQGYYSDDTAEVAQAIFDDRDLHALFDAARNSRPEDLQMAADLLWRLKNTNPDG